MPQVIAQVDSPQEQVLWGVFPTRSPAEPAAEPSWICRILESMQLAIPYELLRSLGTEFISAVKSGETQRFSLHEPLDLTREIQDVLEELQNRRICIPKPYEVYEYLLRFPDMIDVTINIAKKAYHGLSGAQLSLEVYRDPEVEDEYLVLYARYKDYDVSVMEKIEAIREGYAKQLVDKKGWLLLTTDFKPAE